MSEVIVPRNSNYRCLLDPKGILPGISMVPCRSELYEGEAFDVLSTDGQIVVTAALESSRKRPKHMFFEGIFRNPEADHIKGVGLATYLLAIELAQDRGVTFCSSEVALTEHAINIWNKLVSCGIARQIDKAVMIDTDPDGTKVYNANFEVITDFTADRPSCTPGYQGANL